MFAVFVLVLVIGECLGRESHPWIPQIRDKTWQAKHELKIKQTQEHGKDAQIIFIGDSITEMWDSNGKDVWAKYYAPRHAYNYGIGGDSTMHVLYRIENKELDGMKPKVAVLMIGTNNLKENENQNYPAPDIARGVQEILHQLSVRLPSTKVILLGILPRPSPYGAKAQKVNDLLSKMANGKTIFWLDMKSAFAGADGKQKNELFMGDRVHILASGYEVWHKTMEPLLVKLLQ